jgi:hypothetical protein
LFHKERDWEEEEKAFKVLNRACFKISALLARMKLKKIKRFVDKCREKANEIIDSIPEKRLPTSGPEARAAFILRSEVFLPAASESRSRRRRHDARDRWTALVSCATRDRKSVV